MTNPNIDRLNKAIVKAEARLAALYKERDEAIDALVEETRQTLVTLQALKSRGSAIAAPPKEYTGKRRGVVRGTRPVTPTKFTDSEIQDMRQAYDTNVMSQGQLAEMYGVRQPTMSKIVRRMTYTYVPERTSSNGAKP